MKTLRFSNTDPIDLDAITTMGVSVKTGDSPIGFFGTGLKYAIATLLRTGHKVKLIRAGKTYNFSGRKQSIRDQEFNVVYMGNTKLGFTTELGVNWTPLEAYRELASNCMDEGGTIGYGPADPGHSTVFEIRGNGIEEARSHHNKMFLSTRPRVNGLRAEIHDPGHDPNVLYYRGVVALVGAMPFLYTYNITEGIELTEDRTIKYAWLADDCMKDAIMHSDNYDLIKRCLLAPNGYAESTFRYRGYPGETFLRVVEDNKSSLKLNVSALDLWRKGRPVTELYSGCDIDEFDRKIVCRALDLLSIVGVLMREEDFIISNNLSDAHGMVRDGQIVIAKTTLDRGPRFLASTLYEEWVHKTKGLSDYTREFQDLVIDTMFGLADRLREKNLDNVGLVR